MMVMAVLSYFYNDDSIMTVEAVIMTPIISEHVAGVRCTIRQSRVKAGIMMQRHNKQSFRGSSNQITQCDAI